MLSSDASLAVATVLTSANFSTVSPKLALYYHLALNILIRLAIYFLLTVKANFLDN